MSIISLLATTIYPYIRSGHRSGLHRGESSVGFTARFHRLLCPLLTSPMWSRQVTLPSAIFCRTRHPVAHERSPGVNTCLSVRERRVYGHTLRWIEDFVLLCRLVPVWTPYTRFLYVTPYLRGTLPWQGGFLPKYRHRYPVAIPLYPSPPPGWVWDLP